MKKQAFTAALLTALLASAIAVTLSADSAKANPMWPDPPPPPPIFDVRSPESGKAYFSSSVNLTFTVGSPQWGDPPFSAIVLQNNVTYSVQYYLDGVMLGQIDDFRTIRTAFFSVSLTELGEGRHYVEIRAHSSWSVYWDGIAHPPRIFEADGSSGKVYFTVDTSVPRVAVVSVQGRTFDGADVPFNFTVSKPVAWVGYCLDGADAVAIADAVVTQTYGRDNYYVVLAGLAAGSHSLIVYAEDEGGRRGESEAVSFAVAGEAQPEAEPSGSLPVDGLAAASAGVVAAVVCLSLLAYFVKFKRKRG